MNPETRTTLAFAGSAGVLLALVLLTGSRPKEAEVFLAQGKPFYPEFVDPLKATALEVWDYEEATASARPFRVEFAAGRWMIPSHSNYPADAKERLAKTATAVIDLKKDQIASMTEKDHESLGVVDPVDTTSGPKGRGRLVRFFSGTATSAEFIFGKDAGEGKKYVRLPKDKRTYVSKTPGDISSKFEDWVETDLLQVAATAIRKVVIDKYSFDEEGGTIKDRQVNTLAREESSKPWTLNELKDVEDVNTDNVNAMMGALDDLKIAGVRAKPPLIAKLKDMGELKKFTRPQLMSAFQEMAGKGFFIGRDLSVICNEGEMSAFCDDGIVYQLRFGEVLFGTGEEVSAGAAKKPDPAKKPEDKKPEEKKTGTENRYLFLSVRFDESLLGVAPAEPKAYVADPAKKPEEQKAAEDVAKKEKEDVDKKKKELADKIEAGRKRADKLAARFAEWYYVISAEAFKKLRLERPAMVKPKEKKADEKKPEDKHDEKDGHKHDEKKPGEAPKPADKKPEPPKGEAPKAETPKAEPPKADAPKPSEAPKPEAPKADPPKPAEKKP